MKIAVFGLALAFMAVPGMADAASCSSYSNGFCFTPANPSISCSTGGKAQAPAGTTGCPLSTLCCYDGPVSGTTPGTTCTSLPGGSCEISGTCSAVGKVSGSGVCTTGVCCVSNASTSPQVVTFSNPLEFNTVQEVTGALLSALQGIIVLLSLVFIVIGAVMYVTSGGNESQIKTAKGAITAAMIGLALGIAAPSFLKEIAGILDWGGAVPREVSAAPSIAVIAQKVLDFLLSILGVLAIIMLVIGGSMYLLAAGDEGKIGTAKNIVKWAIIGIVVALASLVIVRQIAAFF